jgi:guanylate kinase
MQKFFLLMLTMLVFGTAVADTKIDRQALVVVLSSPSGGGKTSIAEKLFKLDPVLTPVISVTTRAKRPGEVDGKDYHFMDLKKFQELDKQKAFLQTAHVFSNYYGTLRKEVDASLAEGKDVLFVVDWQASRSLFQEYPNNIIRIFVLPPSLAVLQERLSARGTDSAEVIKGRMDQALNEISHWDEYDYVIINAELDKSVAQVQAILQSERLKRTRQVGLKEFVKGLESAEKK